jgi:hypothetical protein
MSSIVNPRFLQLKADYCRTFSIIAKDLFPEGHNAGLCKAVHYKTGVSISKATIARILAGRRGEFEKVQAICEYFEDVIELEFWLDACEPYEGAPDQQKGQNKKLNNVDDLVLQSRSRIRFPFEGAQRPGDNDPTSWVRDNFVELDMVEVEKLPSEYPALNRDILQKDEAKIEDEFDRIGIKLLRGKKTTGSTIIKKHPKVFVYGDPGSGKTSYLQSIALRCREGEFLQDYVPIFVDMRHYSVSRGAETLRTYIEEMLENFDIDAEQLELLLTKGRVLFLIDGLDEVPEFQRQSIQFMVQEILSNYSECRVICSSRLAAIFSVPGAQKVVISPFYSNKQIPVFVRRWFAFHGNDPSVAESMLEKLYSAKYVGIREIARRPVLLNLLCLTYEHNGDFPDRRADVFATGLNVLAKRIKPDDTLALADANYFTEVDVKNILARVANYFFVHLSEQILFAIRDVERIIRAYYQEVHDINPDAVDGNKILKGIEQFNGLLVRWGESYCSFSHLTYQEYFTAEYLVSTNQYREVYRYLTDIRWVFVIELVSELIPREDTWEFFVDFKKTMDNSVNSDTKLTRFLGKLDQAATFVFYTIQSEKSHIQSLIRAWYFAYALENTGSVTSLNSLNKYGRGFHLPDLDFATSMVSNNILQGHEIIYRAYHACSDGDAYESFENAIKRLQVFFSSDVRRKDVIDGWIKLLEEQKVRFDNERDWWEAKRYRWQEKIARLLENLGLPHTYELNSEQTVRLRTYYRISKLLSVCINRSNLPRDRFVEIADSLLRLTHFIPEQGNGLPG